MHMLLSAVVDILDILPVVKTSKESHPLKKIYFAKKFHKRGEGVIWISYLYFFIVNVPKYSSKKKINFHKTPTGGRGHRFMKLFRKIDFFLIDGFPYDLVLFDRS